MASKKTEKIVIQVVSLVIVVILQHVNLSLMQYASKRPQHCLSMDTYIFCLVISTTFAVIIASLDQQTILVDQLQQNVI